MNTAQPRGGFRYRAAPFRILETTSRLRDAHGIRPGSRHLVLDAGDAKCPEVARGESELAFVRAVAPQLADGARRALLLAEASEAERPDEPGLIVVTERWEIESATPGVERWLAQLPDGDLATGRLPSCILALAGRALRTAAYPDQAGEVAVSRVMSRSGDWVVLHGTPLISSSARRVAVIVEPAHPARIAPLLMAAYGLTGREQEVTRLVLQGNSTTEIAQGLRMSTGTVQQHLKSVFDKTGVRSRRDLVGRVFFTHYEPRVRDNERRAGQGQPLQGGPLQGSCLGRVAS
jgi:DNA-binding CsgD family transcriptional regulator